MMPGLMVLIRARACPTERLRPSLAASSRAWPAGRRGAGRSPDRAGASGAAGARRRPCSPGSGPKPISAHTNSHACKAAPNCSSCHPRAPLPSAAASADLGWPGMIEDQDATLSAHRNWRSARTRRRPVIGVRRSGSLGGATAARTNAAAPWHRRRSRPPWGPTTRAHPCTHCRSTAWQLPPPIVVSAD
jgi:hypothetical protein